MILDGGRYGVVSYGPPAKKSPAGVVTELKGAAGILGWTTCWRRTQLTGRDQNVY